MININNIVQFLTAPTFIFFLKIIFITIGAILSFGIIIILINTNWAKFRFLESWTEFLICRPFGVNKTFKQWAKISKKLDSGKTTDYKMSLIEADSLLDDILEKMGFKGESMKERLEQAAAAKMLSDIENIQKAHKLRNNIVHDPDYNLSLDKAKETLQAYEKALRDLELF
jgi:hypothetical protein